MIVKKDPSHKLSKLTFFRTIRLENKGIILFINECYLLQCDSKFSPFLLGFLLKSLFKIKFSKYE